MHGTKGGCVIWLTGLPASGKTTLALALARHYSAKGRSVAVLDGDQIRATRNRDLGFSMEDRAENVRRVARSARDAVADGFVAVVALISPLRANREEARRIIGARNFVEVHVSTPLAICEARDPKGLYRKARLSEIHEFTGVQSPYEEPDHPAIRVDTSEMSPDASVARIASLLDAKLDA